MDRKLRMGMVGGGRDSFIGPVHRIAAQMDSKIELVCGAFSSTPEKSRLSGQDLLLPPERVYGTYQEMFRKEAQLPDGDGMDFVSIVTPNNMHHPMAMAALEAGFHVVCDKPMTLDLEEARDLERKVRETRKLFCLTHNYTGYPMVKELAGDQPRGHRAEAGSVAHRPADCGRVLVHGRHRDPLREPRRVHNGASDYRDVRRPHDVRNRTPAGR